jgi:hypothetical protein
MEFKKYVSTIFIPLQNFCLDKTKQFKYYATNSSEILAHWYFFQDKTLI